MNRKKFHDIAFYIHRYIGLVVGFIVVLIGLTGSLLVFRPEIEYFLVTQKFGHIVPGEQRISIDLVAESVKSAIAQQPDLKIGFSILPNNPTSFYHVRLWDSKDKLTQMFIHPYTGEIMGWSQESSDIMQLVVRLHYELLAGKPGLIITGVTGLLLFILSLTGVILWPGWRKLIAGFKIKWNAHFKRVNFDIHKVTGIIAVVFLSFTGFIGFCWNFYDQSVPFIYAVTLTPKPPELVSQKIPSQSPLPLSQILKNADAVLPNTKTTYIGMPDQPEGIIRVGKRQAHETFYYGESEVLLDQYNGEVLRVSDSRSLALGDRILTSFVPLHYGTFWGFTSRILYVFVSFAPLILFVTSLVMWWHRYRVDTMTATKL
ncbi:PepSY-associated TM helix domain-containing protein [Chlorogloeopsis sp. ULAP01]|uniref:PepSY-associated TM helix domain-containing protein n=1 Tax=Chlorogloeopsis sp. ULAP01 TaxID=3056483 RepID=UPI0025AB5BFB|nr:PepSY-associated TM helix domain-containing protein [Chlorogloeopsis sp. ULAP01]MDM9385756.1 PepSY-associated TM helix domain-containing protein [Chlorogloeopsis sp. ULAP01]